MVSFMLEHRPRRRHVPSRSGLLPMQALDDLRYIRRTMEESSSFTAVPGWGQVVMGITALGAAAIVAARPRSNAAWLELWLVEACVAVSIAVVATWMKADRSGLPLTSGPGRKFVFSFLPAMFAGALLTIVLYRAGLARALPGSWLLLYGTGVVSAGTLSVPSVRLMGGCFMLAGVSALFLPATWGNLLMAVGFGGLHLGFGLWIARRHGG